MEQAHAFLSISSFFGDAMAVLRFTNESLFTILERVHPLREQALLEQHDFCFEVPNPDIRDVYFSGETVTRDGVECIVRSFRAWVEFGELLHCRFKTPEVVDESFVRLRWEPYEKEDSWHTQEVEDITEKYGVGTPFFRLNKLEEPHFLASLRECYLSLDLQAGERVLFLGSHKGDELHLLREVLGPERFATLSCVGVDHCGSAVDYARTRFDRSHVEFLKMDLNDLLTWEAEPFHLIVSVGTLHSPGVQAYDLFRSLTRERLHPNGAVVLGFPNCRYVGGELQYGARARNYETMELSLMLKDLMFYRRYMNKKGFRVRMTGKYYLFLTGSKRGLAKVDFA